MPVVDTHCHVSLSWYEPVEVLLAQMDRNGVERAVLVQMMGQTDNGYQEECVRRFPDRLASVVAVDARRPDAPAILDGLAARGASGVRLRVDTRSPGDDPLAIWRRAARLGLPVSCAGDTDLFTSAALDEVVDAVDGLPVVIEHLGSTNNPGSGADPEDRARICAVARHSNAHIKLHGLGEFARRAVPVTEPFPFATPVPPLLDRVYEAFGAARMMWGSDYPPVSGREGYRNALRLPMEHLAAAPAADRELIFGRTAQRVFFDR